jgi:hypothetical protein
MTVCADYRIPHSEFLGWDPVDRDKAIWWHLRKSETCAGCGTRYDDWDPDKGGSRQAYGAEIHRCRGCEVRESAAESDAAQGRGIYIVMRRNENPYGHR